MKLYDSQTRELLLDEEVKTIAFHSFEGSLFIEIELEEALTVLEWPESVLIEVGGSLVAEVSLLPGGDPEAKKIWFR